MSKKPTYEEVAQALIDLLDGANTTDIVRNTGETEARANEILCVYRQVADAKERREW